MTGFMRASSPPGTPRERVQAAENAALFRLMQGGMEAQILSRDRRGWFCCQCKGHLHALVRRPSDSAIAKGRRFGECPRRNLRLDKRPDRPKNDEPGPICA